MFIRYFIAIYAPVRAAQVLTAGLFIQSECHTGYEFLTQSLALPRTTYVSLWLDSLAYVLNNDKSPSRAAVLGIS